MTIDELKEIIDLHGIAHAWFLLEQEQTQLGSSDSHLRACCIWLSDYEDEMYNRDHDETFAEWKAAEKLA